MPLVNVKLIEGVFSDEQKQDIVRRLTDAMVEIEGENMRQVTWVIVEEVKSGDWGVAGQPLSTNDVKKLAAGTPVGQGAGSAWRGPSTGRAAARPRTG
jgi:4-oxalocrotonate tautomerase